MKIRDWGKKKNLRDKKGDGRYGYNPPQKNNFHDARKDCAMVLEGKKKTRGERIDFTSARDANKAKWEGPE